MPDIINSQTITIKVDLSCCQDCVKQIKRLLKSVQGVESISIDVKSGTVIVSGHIDQPHHIVDRITESGKVVTFYSVQSDDDQPISSKPAEDKHNCHKFDNKDFGECSGRSSASPRQPQPVTVTDDNQKSKPHGKGHGGISRDQQEDIGDFESSHFSAKEEDKHQQQQQPISKPADKHNFHQSQNKDFGECSRSASEWQPQPVADENKNTKPHDQGHGRISREQEDIGGAFFRDTGHGADGKRSHFCAQEEEYQTRCFKESRLDGGQQSKPHGKGHERISREQQNKAFFRDTGRGADGERSHFCAKEEESHQTRCCNAGEGVERVHDHHGPCKCNAVHCGCSECGNSYSSYHPSWPSFSDSHNFHGPNQVHNEAEHMSCRLNSRPPDFDSFHNFHATHQVQHEAEHNGCVNSRPPDFDYFHGTTHQVQHEAGHTCFNSKPRFDSFDQNFHGLYQVQDEAPHGRSFNQNPNFDDFHSTHHVRNEAELHGGRFNSNPEFDTYYHFQNEGANSRRGFNSKVDFDYFGASSAQQRQFEKKRQAEMMSRYRGQNRRQQTKSDSKDFLAKFFSDDSFFGCSIM